MTVDRGTLVLLDAACLVAAAASDRGGSRFVVSLCVRGYRAAASSNSIALEAECNVRKKLGDAGLARLRRDTAAMAEVEARAATLARAVRVNPKDRHVLEAALGASADFLLTLDARLVRELDGQRLPFRAVTPADFIRNELPTHPDFPFTHH